MACKVRASIATSVLMLIMVATAAAEAAKESETTSWKTLARWLDQPFENVAAEILGPTGGRIFPLWDRDSHPPSTSGILLKTKTMITIGKPQEVDLELYLKEETLYITTIVANLQHPMQISDLESLFQETFEPQRCVPIEYDDADELPLVPSNDGGAANIAVARNARLVAEMFSEPGVVQTLRWIGGQHELPQCP